MTTRFDTLPSRLREVSIEKELAGVPCLLVRMDEKPRPFLFWMHGRTADKELDPGRYLRCVRRGINVCAVDLPDHGQRCTDRQHHKENILGIIQQMSAEIQPVLDELEMQGGFDLNRAAIGGMSAGGLTSVYHLCSPHNFKAVILEASGGEWIHLRNSDLLPHLTLEELEVVNPMNHLTSWKDVPVIAFHNKHDVRVPFETTSDFIGALKDKSPNPEDIELVAFERSGAPNEHMGFGRESAFVKEVQVEFLAKHLSPHMELAS
ncbi:MAG: prolyl oligopeptidase family serine peptidase [Phycisphaerales bacterium]|jgi:dienelactone hydrolase|nr:prolyl oligopeptidase family serine peptidase [Phycisphaerales bacterium]